MYDDETRRVGANLRRLRRSRGLSLDVVAGRAGLSKGFISRAERGERSIDRRSHLDALSRALECSIADILGQPFPSIGRTQELAHAQVPALRRVLHASSLGYDDAAAPVRGIDELAQAAADVWQARRLCDYPMVARILPGLLEGLHRHARRGPDTASALRLLVEATSAATFSLRALGYADLAWTAAEQCHAAAIELGDPVAVGFADFTRAQATSLGPGFAGSLALAEGAADALRQHMGNDPEDQRVYGQLLLTAAWAAGVSRHFDRVTAYVNEAMALGERIGDAAPEGDRWQTYFGPSNTGIWRMTIAVESGEGGRVAELKDVVHLEAIDSKSRRAAF